MGSTCDSRERPFIVHSIRSFTYCPRHSTVSAIYMNKADAIEHSRHFHRSVYSSVCEQALTVGSSVGEGGGKRGGTGMHLETRQRQRVVQLHLALALLLETCAISNGGL